MSRRPTASYGDVAIEPDHEFDRMLRRRLDHDLRSVPTSSVLYPIEIELELPLPPSPEPLHVHQRRRSGRSIFAVTAAIAASIALGIVVDRLVSHDHTETPVVTIPPFTSPMATIATPPTDAPATTAPTFTADDIVAIKTLLWNTDYNLPGFVHVAGAPVELDGLVADRLPACQAFVPTAFESEGRPAAIQSRLFQNPDQAHPQFQYVAVHPTVAQATAMLDEMQDPAFLGECVPAYLATVPTDCCNEVTSWFPFVTGDEELPPQAIVVAADDVWLRRYTHVSLDAGEGRTHRTVVAFAAIRVGRVVSTVDVMLSDNGVQLATTHDFERIVQHLAARAAAAQATR